MRPPTRRASDIGQLLAYQWSLANLRKVCSPLVYTQGLKMIRWTHEEVLRLKASGVLAGKAATVKLQ